MVKVSRNHLFGMPERGDQWLRNIHYGNPWPAILCGFFKVGTSFFGFLLNINFLVILTKILQVDNRETTLLGITDHFRCNHGLFRCKRTKAISSFSRIKARLCRILFFVLAGPVSELPQEECYAMCVKGWTGHIAGSLQNLLNTGKGQPA